jgi:hypothetical protein
MLRLFHYLNSSSCRRLRRLSSGRARSGICGVGIVQTDPVRGMPSVEPRLTQDPNGLQTPVLGPTVGRQRGR